MQYNYEAYCGKAASDIKIKEGCLFEALERKEITHILHCVNTVPRMSSGIAKEIKERFPSAYNTYLEYSYEQTLKFGRPSLLGTVVVTGPIIHLYAQYSDLTEYCSINNIGAESDYPKPRLLDYGALAKCLQHLKGRQIYKQSYEKYGLPFNMGSDKAGGDWTIVKELIDFSLISNCSTIYKKSN